MMTDAEALELAIETVLNTPEDVKGRHDQIRSMIAEDRDHAGKFCSYHLQYSNLGLKPWELAPCNRDGSTNGPADRLYRRMLKAGISQYHPDPLKALQEAGAGNGVQRAVVKIKHLAFGVADHALCAISQ